MRRSWGSAKTEGILTGDRDLILQAVMRDGLRVRGRMQQANLVTPTTQSAIERLLSPRASLHRVRVIEHWRSRSRRPSRQGTTLQHHQSRPQVNSTNSKSRFSFPSPAFRERRHRRRLACRRVTVRRRAILMMPVGHGPQPRRSDRRSGGLHDARDNGAIGETRRNRRHSTRRMGGLLTRA
jgi:hypothetical protein